MSKFLKVKKVSGAAIGFTMLSALTLAACSSPPSSTAGPGATPSTKLSTTTTATPVFNSAELQAKLVPISQVPAGFSIYTDSSNSAASGNFCGVSNQDLGTAAPANAKETFSSGTLGPFLVEGITGYNSVADAQQALDKLRTALEGCQNFNDSSDGTTTSYSVGAMSFPSLSADQFALTVSLKSDFATGDIPLVAVQKGTTVVLSFGVSVVSPFGGGQLPPTDFEQFTTTAVKLVQG